MSWYFGEGGWVHFEISLAWDTCGVSIRYVKHSNEAQNLELENMGVQTT